MLNDPFQRLGLDREALSVSQLNNRARLLLEVMRAVADESVQLGDDELSSPADVREHLSRTQPDYLGVTAEKALVPEIAATAASAAVYAALSGDESKVREIEAKANALERTIEEQVEKRADALEKRAEALCPIVEGLDELESQLALRIDEKPLDIVYKR